MAFTAYQPNNTTSKGSTSSFTPYDPNENVKLWKAQQDYEVAKQQAEAPQSAGFLETARNVPSAIGQVAKGFLTNPVKTGQSIVGGLLDVGPTIVNSLNKLGSASLGAITGKAPTGFQLPLTGQAANEYIGNNSDVQNAIRNSSTTVGSYELGGASLKPLGLNPVANRVLGNVVGGQAVSQADTLGERVKQVAIDTALGLATEGLTTGLGKLKTKPPVKLPVTTEGKQVARVPIKVEKPTPSYEPYIPEDKLPVIEMGNLPPKPKETLPTIKIDEKVPVLDKSKTTFTTQLNPETKPIVKGVQKYPTIHQGGKIKMVDGEPVNIIDGVETFIHKGDGGWVVSESSTGRFLGDSVSKYGAIAKAKFNIANIGEDKFKQLVSENQLPNNSRVEKSLQSTTQTQKKWKTGDSADKVQNVLKIPIDKLSENADYVKPSSSFKGAMKYGFYVDEHAPLEITIGKNGQKISHGYNHGYMNKKIVTIKPKSEIVDSPLTQEARKHRSVEKLLNTKPFSIDEQNSWNNNTHFTIDYNKEYTSMVGNIAGKIQEKLGQDVPSEIQKILEEYSQKTEVFLREKGKQMLNAPSPYVTGRAGYNFGKADKARNFYERKVSEFNDYTQTVEKKIDSTAKSIAQDKFSRLSETEKIQVEIDKLTKLRNRLNPIRDDWAIEQTNKKINSLTKKLAKQSQLTDIWKEANKSEIQISAQKSQPKSNIYTKPEFDLTYEPITNKSEPILKPRTTQSLKPIEGTGEVKVRGLSQKVEAGAIEKGIADNFGDLPEYKTVNMKDQARRASDLISKDYATARSVALGEKAPPKGTLPESLFVAVEKKALADGDVQTLQDLANSKLTSSATTMGQRIRTLAERDPNSPIGAIQEVQKARQDAIAKRVNIPKETQNAVRDIQAHIKKVAPPKETWSDFITSLQC